MPETSIRIKLLQAVAEAGRGAQGFQAHFNVKEGGHVYFPFQQVRLHLREDMMPLDSAIVDAAALEIMLERFRAQMGGVHQDFVDGSEFWTFRALRVEESALIEVGQGEGYSRAQAVAAAYAQAFAPKAVTA